MIYYKGAYLKTNYKPPLATAASSLTPLQQNNLVLSAPPKTSQGAVPTTQRRKPSLKNNPPILKLLRSFSREATPRRESSLREQGFPNGQRPFGRRAMFAKQTRLLDEVQLCSGETPLRIPSSQTAPLSQPFRRWGGAGGRRRGRYGRRVRGRFYA